MPVKRINRTRGPMPNPGPKRFKSGFFFLIILAAFIWTIFFTREMLAASSLPESIGFLGFNFPLLNLLTGLIYTFETILFGVLTDVCLFGYKSSSLYRLFHQRTASLKLDVWSFLFTQVK